MDEFNKEVIIAKINDGKVLTDAEERWYMISVLGLSGQEADRIIAIANNKDPNVILD